MPPEQAASDNAAPPPVIVGYIDGIRERRVSGWVWDKNRPQAPLDVEVRLDDRVIAVVCADRHRRDLEKGGVGDGRHAFEAFLDDPLPAGEGYRVQAFARPGGAADPVKLINRTAQLPPPGRDPGDVGPEDFRRWLDEFAAVQNNFEAALRSVAAELRDSLRQRSMPAAVAQPDHGAILDEVRTTLAEVGRQMSAFEVFQVRFDQVLNRLEQVPAPPRGRSIGDRGLMLAVAAATAMAALSLGIGVFSLL